MSRLHVGQMRRSHTPKEKFRAYFTVGKDGRLKHFGGKRGKRDDHRITAEPADNQKMAQTFWEPSWNVAAQRVFYGISGMAVRRDSSLRAPLFSHEALSFSCESQKSAIKAIRDSIVQVCLVLQRTFTLRTLAMGRIGELTNTGTSFSVQSVILSLCSGNSPAPSLCCMNTRYCKRYCTVTLLQ